MSLAKKIFEKLQKKEQLPIYEQIRFQIISFAKEIKVDFKDVVVVGLDLPVGKKEIEIGNLLKNGTKLCDAYSNQEVEVKNGKVEIDSYATIVLLEL